MLNGSQFDVFLCHNSEDKPQVEEIRTKLREKQIYAWLDKYDFEPFRSWQKQLEEIMPQIKAAAVFLGKSGVGPWQNLEMNGFLQEFVERDLRMGLVILPGCPDQLIKEVPRFLRDFHYVDFRQQFPDPMNQLVWGITGEKQALECSLVESPTNLLAATIPSKAEGDDAIHKLKELLEEAKWQEADQKTKEIILAANKGSKLKVSEIKLLSLDLLKKLDEAWMSHSNEKFGLIVQLSLWQKSFESPKSMVQKLNPFAKKEEVTSSAAWNRFGRLVGWRSEDNTLLAKVDFSLNAPQGCFPQTRLWLNSGHGNTVKQFEALMERIKELTSYSHF